VHFSNYLESLKDNATDIDNWILVELEKVMAKYKSQPEIFFKKSPLS